MKMIQKKRIVGGLALSALMISMGVVQADSASAPVQAVTATDQSMLTAARKNGFYAGFTYHYASADWSKAASANGSGKKNSSAFSGVFGFRYNSHLAFQGSLWYFTGIDGVLFKTQARRGSASAYGFSASLKLIMPLMNQLDAFARGGFAYRAMSLDGDAGLLSSLFGFGIEYNLNPNISFNLGYTYLAGDATFNDAGFGVVPAYNMLSVGMNYNFVM